jgi:hypothetical protein
MDDLIERAKEVLENFVEKAKMVILLTSQLDCRRAIGKGRRLVRG